MTTTPSIEDLVGGNIDALSGLGGFGDFGFVPGSTDELLSITVGEYLGILDAAESTLTLLDPSLFQTLLANPFVTGNLSPDELAQFQAFAAGDFSEITGPIQEVRDILSQFPSDATMREVFESVDGGDEALEELEAEFTRAQQEVAALLWDETNGVFTSPTFNLDLDTESWFADLPGGYSGNTLAEFWGTLGEAAGSAIMAFIGTSDSVIGELLNADADGSAVANATNAAEAAAADAFEKLQELGNLVTEVRSEDPNTVEAQARQEADDLINAITAILPGVSPALETLILGSRNSDPSFVVSVDGNVDGSPEGDWFYLSKVADTFDGQLGKDLLFGFEGDDDLDGGEGEDQLFGGADNDDLSGGADSDLLVGGPGDDMVDGGDGNDEAAFAGAMGNYTVKFNADGTLMVEDRQADGDGTDMVSNVETLSFDGGWSIFDDGNFTLAGFQEITGLSQDDIDTFIELYIAYFNRAPDALGLYFWGSAFAGGETLEQIAAGFIDQPETRAAYPPDATNQQFAETVYDNVLGRVPDPAGLDFWVGQLNSGSVTRDQFILEVLKGAKADPAPDATPEFIALQQGDRDYLANKVDIGTYFSVIKGMSEVDDASDAMALFLRGDASSIDAAKAKIDEEFAEALAADSGEMLLQLVGVAEDPFAVA